MGFPVVQKLRKGGYDGKGVQVLRSEADAMERGFDAPCILEQAVDIDKELSVIVARNATGDTAVYPVVESVFNPEVNLVDHLMAPAAITSEQESEARKLAQDVVTSMNLSDSWPWKCSLTAKADFGSTKWLPERTTVGITPSKAMCVPSLSNICAQC